MDKKVCCLHRIDVKNTENELVSFDGCNKITFGRGIDNDVVLSESPAISRRHAECHKDTHGNWTITDLNSSNGVYINGARISAGVATPLRDRTLVEMGKNPHTSDPAVYRFTFYRAAKIKVKSDKENIDAPCVNSEDSTQRLDEYVHPPPAKRQHLTPNTLIKQKLAEQKRLLEEEMADRAATVQRELEEKEKQLLLEMEERARLRQEEMERKEEEMKKEIEEREKAMREAMEEAQRKEDDKRKMMAEIEERMREKEQESALMEEKWREERQKLTEEMQNLEKNMTEEKQKEQTELLEKQKEMESASKELQQRLEDQMAKYRSEKEEMANQHRENEVKSQQELEAKRLQLEETKMKLEEEMSAKLEQEQKARAEALAAAQKEIEEKKKGEEKQKQELEDMMEEELMCPICSELFVEAVSLNCSHSYCRLCLNKWLQHKAQCPTCRAPVKSAVRSLVLDNYIDKMSSYLSEEVKERRQKMIQERKAEQKVFEEKQKSAPRNRMSLENIIQFAAQNNYQVVDLTGETPAFSSNNNATPVSGARNTIAATVTTNTRGGARVRGGGNNRGGYTFAQRGGANNQNRGATTSVLRGASNATSARGATNAARGAMNAARGATNAARGATNAARGATNNVRNPFVITTQPTSVNTSVANNTVHPTGVSRNPFAVAPGQTVTIAQGVHQAVNPTILTPVVNADAYNRIMLALANRANTVPTTRR